MVHSGDSEEDVEAGDAFDFDGRSSETDDALNEEDPFEADADAEENADVEEGSEHITEHGEDTGSEDEDEEMEAEAEVEVEGEEEEEEEEESMDVVQKEVAPLQRQQQRQQPSIALPGPPPQIPEIPEPHVKGRTREREERSISPAVERRSKLIPSVANPRSYTVEAIVAIAHPEATHSLAASACMTHLLTGSQDGYVRDYDVFGAVNGKTFLTAPQRAHCGIVEGTMKAGLLRMWWENPGEPTRADAVVEDHTRSPVTALAMHSDALWALAGTEKGHMNLFTVRHEPGQIMAAMEGHRKVVSSLALTHDEKGVFSAGWDGDVYEWDLNTGQQVRKFTSTGAQIAVAVVAVRPSGSGSGSGRGRGWGRRTFSEEDDDARSDGSYDPLFDEEDEEDEEEPPPDVAGSSGSSGSDVVLTASIDGSIVLWDRRVNSRVGRLESNSKSPPWSMSACWSVDGTQVYAGRRNSTVDVWDYRHFSTYPTPLPRLLKTLRNPSSSGPVSSVAAFPDGRHIAVASNDNIRLWNANANEAETTRGRSGLPFKIIPGHHGGIISQMLVDPAARFMVSASSNRGWGTGESTRVVLIHDIKSNT